MSEKPTRFHALDAFRGLTIALMILVNTPGDWGHVYAPLLHADWHGWTPTDLVFPFFLFIVGSAMFFAFKKINYQASSEAIGKVIKRSILMFLIGFGLNLYNFFAIGLEEVRIMGVLQRIGLCYLVASLLILYCNQKQLYIACLAILTGYYFIFLLFGGAEPFGLENSIIQTVDLAILGEAHMYGGFGIPFDPEGVLSTLPAVVNVVFGFEATRRLSQIKDFNVAVQQLVLWGLAIVGVGYFVSLLMPINKNIWSSSYVIFTSGAALLLLALFVWLIDLKGKMSIAKPWQVYGLNPLFIYCLSWIWAATYWAIPMGETAEGKTLTFYTYLWQQLLPIFSEKMASLVFAIAHVVLFWAISYYLYKKKIIIKI
ncbi:DUF1624 domain-containing protein [Catenovulum sp. SM1970]|uniref:acyltransferase family protein n=1 Tax=Marinifaba aquimaris TaxID=2741323 RepID=UPI0015729A60|nr:heparan-alpha-glucosaminide N-acetyltransferase domain-containing protein [Marinifaba aquimaris]NTS76617.1 DUF1624 domain-containing protein [Marinifaba aquimaris]